MDQSTHEVRLASWRTVVEQCQQRPAGTSIKQWLREHEINEGQYYYYQRLLRQNAYDELKADQLSGDQTPAAAGDAAQTSLPAAREPGQITFAEIPVSPMAEGRQTEMTQSSVSVLDGYHPDAVIHTGLGTIGLSNSISESLLRSILEVMCHA